MTIEATVLAWLCRRGAASIATPEEAASYRFRFAHRPAHRSWQPPRRGHPDEPHGEPVRLAMDREKMAADAARQLRTA